jgi:hypothetical protein
MSGYVKVHRSNINSRNLRFECLFAVTINRNSHKFDALRSQEGLRYWVPILSDILEVQYSHGTDVASEFPTDPPSNSFTCVGYHRSHCVVVHTVG